MADNKRYYWIKLKENFFKNDIYEYILSLDNGASYVLIFQTLLMETVNNDGLLCSKIGDMVIPWDMEKIRVRCRYFPIDTIRVAMDIFRKIGWIFPNKEGILKIVDFDNYVGSETKGAERMREYRARQKEENQFFDNSTLIEDTVCSQTACDSLNNDNSSDTVTSKSDTPEETVSSEVGDNNITTTNEKDILNENKTLCSDISKRLETLQSNDILEPTVSKWLLSLCNRVCKLNSFVSRENVRTSANTFLQCTLKLLIQSGELFTSIKRFVDKYSFNQSESYILALVYSFVCIQLKNIEIRKRGLKNGNT